MTPTTLPLLTLQETRRVADLVSALRPLWTPQKPPLPFFSLGALMYLDGPPHQPLEQYLQRAQARNPVLRDKFGGLYARVTQALERLLGQPAQLREDLSLPSFQIFLAHPRFCTEGGEPHLDLQHRFVEWPEGAELEETISFTLPIELPRSGGGLRHWPRGEAWAEEELGQEGRHVLGKAELHRYRAGVLTVHSGTLFHAIAPAPDHHPDDRRITLQGHGVRCGDRWLLFA